eukprot:2689607-Rhodomonas_salina.1
MPDFYMSDVYRCACGDTAVAVPTALRGEGVAQSALWCAGTLRMITPQGEEILVYNPYSLQQLSDEMWRQDVDRYQLCMSRPETFRERYPQQSGQACERLRPQLRDLEVQGIETMAVWARCRANYNMREWDPGAYALFDESLQRQLRVPASVCSGLDAKVGSCLLLAHSRGEGPNACLLEFLSARKETRE